MERLINCVRGIFRLYAWGTRIGYGLTGCLLPILSIETVAVLAAVALALIAVIGYHTAGEFHFVRKAERQGHRVNRRKLRKRTFRRIWSSGTRLASVAIAAVCLWRPTFPIVKAEQNRVREKEAACVVVEDVFAKENAGTLNLLEEDVFRNLTFGQKWDALRSLMNLELAYLGCEPVDLVIYELENKAIAGYFSPKDGYIAINRDMLDRGSMACIKVLLHEVYHVYQYQCVVQIQQSGLDSDLMMFREIDRWRYEYYHYYNVDEDSTEKEIQKYQDQDIESSADEYSDRRAVEYSEYFQTFRKVKEVK